MHFVTFICIYNGIFVPLQLQILSEYYEETIFAYAFCSISGLLCIEEAAEIGGRVPL